MQQISIFIQALENSTAHRPIRDRLSGEVIDNLELLPVLMEIAFDINNKNHYKACWTLELVLEHNINWLSEYLDDFCEKLQHYKHEGAIRSISKICMFSAKQHLKDKKKGGDFLTEDQSQQIIENCFDWLINDAKVASKVYAMRTLFEFGKLHDWIYPELQEILPKDFAYHSPAYHSASKEILQKIAKTGSNKK
ncbi:hypothetical protein J2X31_001857 [Flavobacterium arsenatis]|uniref:Adenylosuccinate lyase n=1 Tax=Flavobacterium arsenatis TaxID=1484332 RepID=A0ABU1TPE4_9FLAO|nr:hypothetical protein [Flavobacterium arsenatis]MDR6967843.1 hypothetical protein [Flavobacterium arsenatis]